MDGSKRVIDVAKDIPQPINATTPENKVWTEEHLDAWLLKQEQTAKKTVASFEAQARTDFAHIENDKKTTIDQPTNNRILTLLNRAEHAYKTFTNRIETIRKDRAETKAINTLFANLHKVEYGDPELAIKMLLEATERIKNSPKFKEEKIFSDFSSMESRYFSRFVENRLNISDSDPNKTEKIEETYHQISSLGPEQLLDPSNYKSGVFIEMHGLGRNLLERITKAIPNEEDRLTYLKTHNLDDLLLKETSTPEERSQIVNTCVEKKIGRQLVLYGEQRAIIGHLQKLDTHTLSDASKQQLFDDLITVSAKNPDVKSWAFCVFHAPELFTQNFHTMSPEQKNTLEISLRNIDVSSAEIAHTLMRLKTETGLSLEQLPEGSKANGFFHLLTNRQQTEVWENQFTHFPDLSNNFVPFFNQFSAGNPKTHTNTFVDLVLAIPEKHKKELPPRIAGEALGYLLINKPNATEQIEELRSFPIDWGTVITALIHSVPEDRFKKASMEQKPLFSKEILLEFQKEKDVVFDSIYKKVVDRSIYVLSADLLNELHEIIGIPNINKLMDSLAQYALSDKSIDSPSKHPDNKLMRLLELFKNLPEAYHEACEKKIEEIGKEKLLTIAMNELNIPTIVQLVMNPKLDVNAYFTQLDGARKTKFLEKIIGLSHDFSDVFLKKVLPVIQEGKNLLLSYSENKALSKSSFSTLTSLDKLVPLSEEDFTLLIDEIAKMGDGVNTITGLFSHFAQKKDLLRAGLEQNSNILFAQAIVTKDTALIGSLEPYLKNPDWKHIGSLISNSFNLVDIAQFNPTQPELKDQIPWGKPLEQLKKTQQIAKREVHCPWRTELIPLVKHATTHELLSMDKTEDGELFTNFVQEFGAFNLPKVFELFITVKRTPTIEELSEKHKKWISDCLGEKAITKAQNPEALLNGLRKFQKDLQGGILLDRIPEGLETELGQEIFNAIRGSTKWARYDELGSLIQSWKETSKNNPDASKVAKGYVEKSYEIATVGESLLTDTEQQSQREKLLENKELQITLKRVMDTYRAGIQIKDLSAWWSEKQKNILDKWRMDLEKTQVKQSQATSDVARNSMQKNIDRLQTQIDELLAIKAPSDTEEPSIAAFLETIARVKKEELGSALQELSAFHMNRVATGDWSEQMRNTVLDSTSVTPSTVERVGDFLTQYVAEHYLNKEQEKHDHTQHTPFTPELTNSLLTAWQLKSDIKKHPIMQTTEKLHALDKGEVLQKKISVSFVPAKGLMRIFAGDVGDACYTSRYAELAGGKHKHLTSVLMVTNRGKGDERIEGSVLFIESETTEGESVLIVRANNPRENLLGKVDPDSLVEASLLYAKEMAQARGIKKTSVIRDQATAASSNRGSVAAYYQTKFAKSPSLTLTNTEETNFNGYDIWNPSSGHPAVEI